MIVSVLLVVTLAVQSSPADTLRLLAQRLPPLSESALVLEVRARPTAVRDAVTDALRRSDTVTARRLAEAYAVSWDDAFLRREVGRFVAWPAERRTAKVWVDSVRRAGITAYSRDGPAAARRIWRQGLVRARAIDDKCGPSGARGQHWRQFSGGRAARQRLGVARPRAQSGGRDR